MDIITKIINQIVELIKKILTSFGVSTDRVDEILGEVNGEVETTEAPIA